MEEAVADSLRLVRDTRGRSVVVTGKTLTGRAGVLSGTATSTAPTATVLAVRDTLRTGRDSPSEGYLSRSAARYLVLAEDLEDMTGGVKPAEGWSITDGDLTLDVVDVEIHADGLAYWLTCDRPAQKA